MLIVEQEAAGDDRKPLQTLLDGDLELKPGAQQAPGQGPWLCRIGARVGSSLFASFSHGSHTRTEL